jgi:hypothetical protein
MKKIGDFFGGSGFRGFGVSGSMKKKGDVMTKAVIHIILIGLLFAVFVGAMNGKIGARGIKQQVLEKELALLIDASSEGSSFEIMKKNLNGFVDDVRIDEGRVFVDVDGLRSIGGYPYFSRFDVDVERSDSKFIVRVG